MSRLRRCLEGAAIILANAHSVTSHKFLRGIIDAEGDYEKNEPHHKERAIVNAPTHYFAHFLRDDSGHRVHRLKECTEPLGEIGNSNSVAGTKQNHHRLTDDTTKAEQNCGDDPGKGCRHEDTYDGLQAVCAER